MDKHEVSISSLWLSLSLSLLCDIFCTRIELLVDNNSRLERREKANITKEREKCIQ